MSAAYAGRLSWKSILHRPLPLLVSALGLAAVLAPLLILYGLKSGIVAGLIGDLRRDPAILRVGLIGHRSLSPDDIARLRALPEVGFVVGAPRSLAARMEMRPTEAAMDTVVADWIPTGAGDPLLPAGATLGEREIAVSEPLAEALGLTAGGTAVASAYRNDQSETLKLTLKVAYILPRRLMGGHRALAPPELIGMIAAFADNYEVPALGIAGKPLAGRLPRYDSLRLYAASIEAVIPLDRIMGELGFRTDSQAASIAWVNTLDVAMTGVFGIISAAGILGFALSLWANVTASLRQYRTQLSLLRLLGLPGGALSVFPLVQVGVISSAGLIVGAAIAGAAATIINAVYLTDLFTGDICQISLRHLAAAAAISYVIATVVVIQQVRSLNRISPSEALAENV